MVEQGSGNKTAANNGDSGDNKSDRVDPLKYHKVIVKYFDIDWREPVPQQLEELKGRISLFFDTNVKKSLTTLSRQSNLQPAEILERFMDKRGEEYESTILHHIASLLASPKRDEDKEF